MRRLRFICCVRVADVPLICRLFAAHVPLTCCLRDLLHVAAADSAAINRLQIADNFAASSKRDLQTVYHVRAACHACMGTARITGFGDNAMTILSNSKK
ncbi:hypothetical protein PQR29_30745 [Paraburkholderia strydomiana]|uniref:hypothetical protein n=1 Tax=Paraburkholderia strydomiana TaxID=1245417 RepID=UPI0038B74F65